MTLSVLSTSAPLLRRSGNPLLSPEQEVHNLWPLESADVLQEPSRTYPLFMEKDDVGTGLSQF